MKSWPRVDIPAVASLELPELSLTNTATMKKEKIVKKDLYRMYVCGITPYDATHLGHAATYLTFDLINRFLTLSGGQVRYVQNITDIDDPLLERANRDGVEWQDLANEQIQLFREDMFALRVIPPTHYVGAVDAIDLVSNAILELEKRESIYSVDGDLYFKVHADKKFGSRSHLSTQEMVTVFAERGGDPSRLGKSDPLDCLVWLAQRPNEPGWSSPFGVGRPGWHIECTAIALKYLEPSEACAELIDIQGGGSDLMFPHHEMCAAQATVMTGKELASSYVHTGMIGLDGEKMSKSKGNLVFVSKLLAKGVDPSVIRWALMKGHYRSDRMWDDQLLMDSENEISVLKSALVTKTGGDALIPEIIELIADDLNTPKILELLTQWSSTDGADSKLGSTDLSLLLDSLLGLKF